MTFKITFLMLAFALFPSLATAHCQGADHAGISCAEGKVFDSATKTCVPVTG